MRAFLGMLSYVLVRQLLADDDDDDDDDDADDDMAGMFLDCEFDTGYLIYSVSSMCPPKKRSG